MISIDDDAEDDGAGAASSSSTVAVPVDILPFCCPHVGPPPSFVPIGTERAMHYSRDHMQGGGGVRDAWLCYGCGNTLHRYDFGVVSPEDRCPVHGSRSTLFDCWPRGLAPLRIGAACTTICSTYLTVRNSCVDIIDHVPHHALATMPPVLGIATPDVADTVLETYSSDDDTMPGDPTTDCIATEELGPSNSTTPDMRELGPGDPTSADGI